MFSGLFSILTSKFGPYALAIKIGLIALVIAYVLMLNFKIASLKNDVKTAQNDLERQVLVTQSWRQAHSYLTKQMRDQNQAIEALAASEKKAKARAVQAIKKAQPKLEARQEQIKQSQKKQQTASSCEAAIEAVKQTLKASLL